MERFVARHVALSEVADTLAQGVIPVVTSSYEELLDTLKPAIVVDAILSKKNLAPNVMMQISSLVWGLDLLQGMMWMLLLKPCAVIT